MQPPKPTPDLTNVPTHVAVIMDGNGRWAQQRHLPVLAGHRAGTENIQRIIQAFGESGVRYVTIYAFSTENWSRPTPEIRGLFSILEEVIGRETKPLHEAGVQLRHIGSKEGIPPSLQEAILESIAQTQHNDRMVLSLAFNYGGRQELVRAVQQIAAQGLAPEAIDEAAIQRNLYTSDLPDPDLIIRTAGEMRLSNFLIWQTAYAEYYASPVFWPDFGPEHVHAALADYSRRQRRFGGRTQP